MKKTIWILFILLMVFFLLQPKTVTLPEIMKPGALSVDDTQIYITENATVFIYALKDFKLIKKFGKEGQGPQEFAIHPRVPLSVDSSTDKLIINSLGKVSFFSKKGEFLKEIRALPNYFNFQPIGDQYLGLGQAFDDNALYNTVNIFDQNLKKIKEIHRADSGLKGPGKGIRVLQKPFMYQGNKDNILLPGEKGSEIDVFDTGMNKRFTITVDHKKKRVTQDFKDSVINYFQTSPRTKDIYEVLLKPVSFPDTFPVYQVFFLVEDRILVLTWEKEKGNNLFFVYDLAGKFLKKVWIPLVYQNDLEFYPITIKGGKLYQLIEDFDSEEWNLHISTVDI